ncbi:MAG: type II/IV secretion system ATPase subunit [Candidatus Aenigmarchaeota archaeon]|nr:type II/IV secretion system ATPase subunit [Candidatus Aenigmarchaeota archaeon]
MIKKVHAHIKGILYRKLFQKKPRIIKNAKAPKTRAGQLLMSRRQVGEYPHFFVIPSKKIISLPEGAKSILYPLIKPYSYAHIRFDEQEEVLIYNVMEPKLTPEEAELYEKIKEGMIQVIDVSMATAKNEDSMVDFLEEKVRFLLAEYALEITAQQYLKLMYYIYRDFIGLNEIEPLLRDPYIEDISCDGNGVPIYVVHQKLGSIKTNVVFDGDEKKLREMVIKLAERCDRYVSYAEPLLDGALPDGTRVQASLAGDVTTKGPTFSIRKFPEKPFSAVDIIALGTADIDMLAYIWFIVEHGSNILITGGTATGKTSLLNSVSLFIIPEAKIVSIEDTRELNLPHENWIPGVSRTGFASTKTGEVSMFDLLKESFRQNPDYLIVGEVRGEEANVMFQGMASGHPCISTMHAGSVDDVLKRLQTRPISLPPGLIETLDVVILMTHAREKGRSARRVKEIIEIERVDPDSGKAQTNKIFSWDPVTDKFEFHGSSHLLGKISAENGIPLEKIYDEVEDRRSVIEWLASYEKRDWKEVARYIVLYYRDKAKVMRAVGRHRRKRVFGAQEMQPVEPQIEQIENTDEQEQY